jgi:hypothetical protein
MFILVSFDEGSVRGAPETAHVKKSIAIKERSMLAVRAAALFTFIRPAPPLWGISGGYATTKELLPQIK